MDEIKFKDKLWLWGHMPGVHNIRKHGKSTITPMAAAKYMDLKNMIMVKYARDTMDPPYTQYAENIKDLDKIIWSIVGAAGQKYDNEMEHVADIMRTHKNIKGVIMDDFFNHSYSWFGKPKPYYKPKEVDKAREYMDDEVGRDVSLWTVLYKHMLGRGFEKYNLNFDVFTYWTWKAKDLWNLEKDFERAQKETNCRKTVLGLYMYDYGTKTEMPLDLMKHQLNFGQELLQAGKIEGMCFLASCICDLDLDAVEMSKEWIAKNKEKSVRFMV